MEKRLSYNYLSEGDKKKYNEVIHEIFCSLFEQELLEEVLNPDEEGNAIFEMKFKGVDVYIRVNINQIKDQFRNSITSE